MKKNNYFSKKFITNIFLTLILIQIFVSLSISNYIDFFNHHGDSAFFVDLLHNIAMNNSIYSEIYSSSYYTFPLLQKTSLNYCDLSSISIDTKNLNIFKVGHLYFISFLLAIPIKLGIETLIFSSILFSANYIAIISLIFWYLKDSNINLGSTLIFLLCIIFWLPFSISWIGQFYFDRFFIFPMIFIIILLEKSRTQNLSKLLFFFLIFYTLLIHERAALMLGSYLISFSILFYNEVKKYFFLFFILGLFLFLYFFCYINFFYDNANNYSKAYSIEEIILYLKDVLSNTNLSGSRMIKFFVLTTPFLLISLNNFKYFIIAIGTLIPNIIITIGGAEKIGLSTHYHTYYIPFLISFAMFSYIKFINNNSIYLKKILCNIYLILLIIFNLSFDYQNLNKILSFKKYSPGTITYIKKLFIPLNYTNLNFQYKQYTKKLDFIDIIPSNSSVSTIEDNHPFFSKKNVNVDFFPIGLGISEFLLLNYQDYKKSNSLNFPTFLAGEQKKLIYECLNKIIKKNYYLTNKINFWHGGSLELWRLKKAIY